MQGTRLFLFILVSFAIVTSCSSEEERCHCLDEGACPLGEFCYLDTCTCYPIFCTTDEDCPDGSCCEEYGCSEYACGVDCTRDDECSDMGPCMECRDRRCASFACDSDADCPETPSGPRMCGDYDDELGCRYCVTIHCGPGADEDCRDPTFPLYVECIYPEQAFCINGMCTCRPPCGGTCPDGQYCCRQTQTCDPIPEPCSEVECPPGEQVNPDPGGTLNEETCQVEGADCSCVPGP
jgi:hypothetical protein